MFALRVAGRGLLPAFALPNHTIDNKFDALMPSVSFCMYHSEGVCVCVCVCVIISLYVWGY